MRLSLFNAVLAASSLLMVACGSSTQESKTTNLEPIVVDYESTTPINSLFEDITLIPLDSENGELLGETLSLHKDGDSYYIVDQQNKTVQRYSLDGKFKNSIGRKGRADNEYNNIMDYNINSQFNILSYPNTTIRSYTKEGEFVGKRAEEFNANSFLQTSKYTYYYLGLSNKYSDARVVVVSNDGSEPERKLLPQKTALNSVSNLFSAFSQLKDTVIFQPIFSSDIYHILDTVASVRYRFDLGKYDVGEEVHNQADMIKAFELMQKNGFATIMLFRENHDNAFTIIMVQADGKAGCYMLGVLDKSGEYKGWQWVKIPTDDDLWANSGFYLDDESNYYMIVPAFKLLGDDVDLSLVKNKEVLESLTDDSNSVIMKCKIKKQ